jgi:hypothetical protein
MYRRRFFLYLPKVMSMLRDELCSFVTYRFLCDHGLLKRRSLQIYTVLFCIVSFLFFPQIKLRNVVTDFRGNAFLQSGVYFAYTYFVFESNRWTLSQIRTNVDVYFFL